MCLRCGEYRRSGSSEVDLNIEGERNADTHLKYTILLLLLLLLLLYDMDVSCNRPFLPGTSLETAVIPTAQASSLLLLLLLLLLYHMDVSCHRPFLPGTSLEPAVIPTAQASSFTLQYFPYYV